MKSFTSIFFQAPMVSCWLGAFLEQKNDPFATKPATEVAP